MDFLEPHIEFSPDKPFHRLVVAYAAQVHGMLDLAARGMREEWERFKAGHGAVLSDDELTQRVCTGIAEGYADHVRAVLESESSPLPGVQRFGAEDGPSVRVDTAKLARTLLQKNQDPITAFAVMSAGSLLILAWESTLDDHSKAPLWEFLRHCRNAAAHKGGRFNFLYDEPKSPARWRSLTIVPKLQGTPLFWNSDQNGLIGPGDALHLLGDIEKEFY